MRRLLTILLLSVSFATLAADAGRVVKVLPFLIDQQGRIAKSPSLFDRDAYQAYLRIHTNDVSGIRYDVLWQAGTSAGPGLKLRVELHGAGEASLPKAKTLEAEIAPGKTGAWTEMKFDGDEYKYFGSITAWRATLWSGTNLVDEQKSFLW
jgi:hypothetical protein